MAVVFVLASGRSSAQTTDTLRVIVHGHRMQLLSSGTGGPTVVLEAGDRSTHRAFNRLRPQLASFTRVVVYDRAGLGQSEFCSLPRNAESIARELQAALTTAGIKPPYILVGHSAGGLFVRAFASIFPETVAGLVLLDPAAEESYPRAEREYPDLYRRLVAADSLDRTSGTPGELAEDAAWETSLAQARAFAPIRAPVILLSSPRQDLGEISDLTREEQRRWTDRQPNAAFRVVSGTGHTIQRDRPDTVIAVIKGLQASLTPAR